MSGRIDLECFVLKSKVSSDTKNQSNSLARVQGRPTRGEKQVGRSRMIEKMREIMKSKPKIDIQRREIAEFMGVTPALVGYYFRDKRSLIEEAANPLIDEYIAQVKGRIAATHDPLETLRSLVYIFVKFNQESGYLLDFYIEHVTTRKNHNSLPKLREVYEEMNGFFSDLMRAGLIRGEDPRLVQSAVWGMCRYIGQQHNISDAPLHGRGGDLASLQVLADSIFDLIVNGIWIHERVSTAVSKTA